jgi:transcriptional regulator with XRE-family HTH domain
MDTISKADHAVGQEVRRHRRQAGLTQKEVAARIGVTGAQFHRYETGETRISASRLIEIAKVLRIDIRILLAAASSAGAEPPVLSRNSHQQVAHLVQMFSSIVDPRHRAALLAVARMMVPLPE